MTNQIILTGSVAFCLSFAVGMTYLSSSLAPQPQAENTLAEQPMSTGQVAKKPAKPITTAKSETSSSVNVLAKPADILDSDARKARAEAIADRAARANLSKRPRNSAFDVVVNDDLEPGAITVTGAGTNEASPIEVGFASESYDTQWAPATEQKLQSIFTQKNLNDSYLNQASCKSTLCKIEVSHVNAEAERRFLAAFASSGAFIPDGEQGYYEKVVDENGNAKTVFYYAREGYTLPTGSL